MTKVSGPSSELIEEVHSALHHDAVSRTLGLSGFSKLSNDHAQLFKKVLASQSDIGSSSSSSKRRHSNSKSISHKYDDDKTEDLIASSVFEILPNFYQIHNPRCKACDSALIPGINCRTERRGFECFTCGVQLVREEPNSNVKRQFRSTRCRQSDRRAGDLGKTALLEMEGTITKRDQTSEQMLPVQNTKANLTLQERAASMKKKKKKTEQNIIEREMEGIENLAKPLQVDKPASEAKELETAKSKGTETRLLQSEKGNPTSRLSELQRKKSSDLKPAQRQNEQAKDRTKMIKSKDIASTSSRVDSAVNKPVGSRVNSQKKDLNSQKKDTLRQMLAEKKAKKEKSNSSSNQSSGGLADFLGSL